MTLSRFTRLRSALAAGCLWLVVAAPLAFGGFSATLSPTEKSSLGLDALSVEERALLDQLVAEDLALARRENPAALAGTFASRLDEAARKQAGLDRLTPAQLAALNERVAAAVANRPAPRERPRLKQADVLAAKKRGEIHGSVTLAYGWGGGREVRAGSLWLDYYDPENRFGLGVGITTVNGDGFYGYHPGYHSGRYFHDPYYPADFYYDDFRASPLLFLGASYLESRGAFFPTGAGCLDGSGFPGRGFGGRRR
jgi:hypothetical protein